MLYLLLVITISFTVLNLVLQDWDYMHPSFLFALVFFAYTFVCVVNRKAYEITIEPETVAVIFTGLAVFTFVGVLSHRIYGKHRNSRLQAAVCPARKIIISNWIVAVLLVLQVVTLAAFVVYIRRLTAAYNVSAMATVEGHVSESSLSEMINLYDTMTKFWSSFYESLAVPIPMAYRILNPVTSTAAYILIYVIVNNFLVDHKINLLQLASVGMLALSILLTGSRSPLFRLVTMALVLFYILSVKQGRRPVGDRKFFFRMAGVVLLAGASFVILLSVMGRTDDNSAKIGHYLFIYMGAPVVNLNTYIAGNAIYMKDGLLGEQTFHSLYSYLGKILGMPSLTAGYKAIGHFEFSANGIEIGNVYTMFYKIVYDFGYGGVIPLTMLQALYYVGSYDRILDTDRSEEPLYFRLFIYSYLFNDLVMSAFSARFYETTLFGTFWKLAFLGWVYDIVLFRRRIHLGSYRVELVASNIKLRRYDLRMRDRRVVPYARTKETHSYE